jgi:hypothetical protein
VVAVQCLAARRHLRGESWGGSPRSLRQLPPGARFPETGPPPINWRQGIDRTTDCAIDWSGPWRPAHLRHGIGRPGFSLKGGGEKKPPSRETRGAPAPADLKRNLKNSPYLNRAWPPTWPPTRQLGPGCPTSRGSFTVANHHAPAATRTRAFCVLDSHCRRYRNLFLTGEPRPRLSQRMLYKNESPGGNDCFPGLPSDGT